MRLITPITSFALWEADIVRSGLQLHSYCGLRAHALEDQVARQEIQKFGQLQQNWDGEGALSINRETTQNALTVTDWIFASAPIPDIMPTSNGTISMEWETQFGAGHLEIGRTKYSFYIDRPGCESFFASGSIDRIEPYLGVLISSTLFPTPPGTAISTAIESDVRSADRNL